MTPEGNKAIVQRWVTEILDQGNLVGLERYVGSTSLDHAVLPGMAADREGTRQLLRVYRQAFPDMRVHVDDMIAEFLGLVPTGRQVTVTMIDWHRLVEGRQVEHWSQVDLHGLLQQLGAIPPSLAGQPESDTPIPSPAAAAFAR
jgi:predicted ester cyclase